MNKIAIILGQFSIGARPLDFHFDNINTSGRGLTGTDLSLVRVSKELKNLGNEVHIFTCHAQPNNKPSEWEGMKLYNFEERFQVVDDSFDVIISIHEPDVFRGMTAKPLRVCYQMLNDFTYCANGFADFVDQWVAVCEDHKNHLVAQHRSPPASAFKIVPLGCDPNLYQDKRVDGRMVWTSSNDRGLHNLLEIFPYIKSKVSSAHLKIFYHFEYGDLLKIEPNDTSTIHHTVEMSQRLRYIKECMARLKPLGVERIGSVSRAEMAKQMSEASVFPFSCDTVAKTEGFSVSTLESHASFTVPVITDQDCLGSIYENSGCVMIKSPVRKRLTEYADAVIKGLTDRNHANAVIEKCRAFALAHTWTKTAEKLQDVINSHPKFQTNKMSK